MKSLKFKLTEQPLNMHENNIVDIDVTCDIRKLVNTKTRDKTTYIVDILQEIWWKYINEITP